KAVVSLPQITFEPYTSTKTSILFAQKKTKNEILLWNEAWNEASKEYSKLKTRVENLIAVYDGTKEKNKLPSIKGLSAKEESQVICDMLYNCITERDHNLSADELIGKYRIELETLCKFDKDTVEMLGYVNTWWIFGKVSQKLNYDIFMAEADNIGYKRTKRGEKEMPNDLYTLEYAPDRLNIAEIEMKYDLAIANVKKLMDEWSEKLSKEKKKDKQEAIQDKLQLLSEHKSAVEKEYAYIKAFIPKYYDNGILRAEFTDRTEDELIKEFKSGYLTAYCSYRVALHESAHVNILDYMRDIVWD
ncbi:MAG: hypothetical protein K2P25_07710, partial [Lachnospiraceae bacterium]|nr:hypothetical protein [Lachnospiraceae bacterium]